MTARLASPAWALAALLLACAPAAQDAHTSPVERIDPSSPEALYAEGMRWRARGDLIRAERYLALAVQRGYPEGEALPALVAVCVQASRLRAALDHVQPFLRRHPDAWQVRYLVASLHLALGNRARALDELTWVVADPHASADAFYAHARLVRDELGDARAAGASFAAYLAREPAGIHAAEARRALGQAGGEP